MNEKVFAEDLMSKRERVVATLCHQPVDRVALHDQVSYNMGVIEMYTGKKLTYAELKEDDICEVIRKTLDMCFRPSIRPSGQRITRPDGFVTEYDDWTYWLVSRPFSDEEGAKDWLLRIIDTKKRPVDNAALKDAYYKTYNTLKSKIGDTVFCDFSTTGFCSVYSDFGMGLELFSFFSLDYPDILHDYMEASVKRELNRIHAIGPDFPEPVILIPEDFATKQGSIFSPGFLREFHFPYVTKLTEAWHEYGIKVIYHSDGNWKQVIQDLIDCGVDGFYCLEKNCGMDIVEFKNTYPELVWLGGIDGVDLMERGDPEQVKAEVKRHILSTNALETGGMFISSSSEINPPIKPENFKAMIEATGAMRNSNFNHCKV